MSRALLRGAKILIMDEATASVDPATDAIIQDTIRGIAQSVNKDATESRLKCSIICVAHRLETIIYYDKVLVLDEGKVAEYDTPAALLTPLETTEETTEPQQQGGDTHKAERLFLSLCSARGPDTLKRLRLAANEAERQSNEAAPPEPQASKFLGAGDAAHHGTSHCGRGQAPGGPRESG